jgi:hypothetical protein
MTPRSVAFRLACLFLIVMSGLIEVSDNFRKR